MAIQIANHLSQCHHVQILLVEKSDCACLKPLAMKLAVGVRADEDHAHRHQQAQLQDSLAAQDTLNKQLLDQLAQQLNALDSANVALQKAQRRLMSEREQERKLLARELHDDIIQDLLSVNYGLENIASQLQAQADKPAHAEIGELSATIRELIVNLRQICGNPRANAGS